MVAKLKFKLRRESKCHVAIGGSNVQIEYRDDPTTLAALSKLKERNDVLMRVVCAMEKAFFKANKTLFSRFLEENAEASKVIDDHRKADEEQWYNTYKKQYPAFSKEEIVKMVKAGILEDK